jgi:hypothetical protein
MEDLPMAIQIKYRCIEKCFHKGNLYVPGDYYEPDTVEIAKELVPEWFARDEIEIPEPEVKNVADAPETPGEHTPLP